MPGSDGQPAQVKTRVIGDYELFAKIGKGGMGTVYKARQTSTGRTVAFKVLPPSFAARPDLVARFQREVRILLGLRHENIVEGIDSGSHGNLHYLAMEYVKGESVAEALRREDRFDGRKTLRIMFDCARALAYAHAQGLIHRDVKPENILMTPDGRIKLCDLGLAREQSDTGFTMVGTALGTPKYMSPEQVEGVKTIDGRADVYSLGATAYHMLTGRVPYDAASGTMIMAAQVSGTLTPVGQLLPGANPHLAAVIEHCLEKKPEDRYQKMAELAEDLRLVHSGGAPLKAGARAPVPAASAAGVAGDASPSRPAKPARAGRPAGGNRARGPRSHAALPAVVLIALIALIAAGVWALFWGPLEEHGDIVKRRLGIGGDRDAGRHLKVPTLRGRTKPAPAAESHVEPAEKPDGEAGPPLSPGP